MIGVPGASPCRYCAREVTPPANTTERQTLHDLYRRHRPRVRARCRRLLRDSAAAEDATHEIFLRVRPYLGTTPDDELLALLYRIASNYCSKVLRHRSVCARYSAGALEPHQHPDALLLRCSARRALEQLPEQTQRVAVLTYAAGMTQDEVAHCLGISRRTVVYRLSELRRAG